jgi:hypothetical protein
MARDPKKRPRCGDTSSEPVICASNQRTDRGLMRTQIEITGSGNHPARERRVQKRVIQQSTYGKVASQRPRWTVMRPSFSA